jgi:hypothetical protein
VRSRKRFAPDMAATAGPGVAERAARLEPWVGRFQGVRWAAARSAEVLGKAEEAWPQQERRASLKRDAKDGGEGRWAGDSRHRLLPRSEHLKTA